MKEYIQATIEVSAGFMIASAFGLAGTACWYYIIKLIYNMYCLTQGC